MLAVMRVHESTRAAARVRRMARVGGSMGDGGYGWVWKAMARAYGGGAMGAGPMGAGAMGAGGL
jgi:hypothetical protein